MSKRVKGKMCPWKRQLTSRAFRLAFISFGFPGRARQLGWKIAIPPVCEDIFFKSVCGGEHRLTLAWWSTEMDANKYPHRLPDVRLGCDLKKSFNMIFSFALYILGTDFF